MAKTRSALGRGLSSLIPDVPDAEEKRGSNVTEIEISKILTNPFQPRKDFSEEEIKELASSIKENGLLQPIVVRRINDKYEIIYGERRTRAHKELNRTRIPAIVKDSVSDTDMMTMALIENLQRQDLNAIEEANAYEALLSKCNYTHEELATQVGKSRTAITNTIRLLKLPKPVQKKLAEKEISMGHARALIAIENEEEINTLCDTIIKEGLSVRQTESIIKNGIDTTPPKKKTTKKKTSVPASDANIEDMVEQLRYALGTQVRINHKDNKGSIEIEYYNNSDLDRIYNILIDKTA